MNNKIFISRCETVLTTMRAATLPVINTGLVAKWLNIEPASALQFISKACKYNIFYKEGGASKTMYKLTEACLKKLDLSLLACNSNVSQAINKTVDWFVNNSAATVKEITLASGKKLTKIESVEKLDSEAEAAIFCLTGLINQNKDLRAEVSLLRDEVERLRKYEEYYNQIKQVKL